MPPFKFRRRLGLEALETRTLFAGNADPFGLLADFSLTETALSGVGDYTANFSPSFGNKRLVLTGTPDSVLTIDLDKLPDFITNLSIASFSSVNFVGTDKVQNLILSDIGTVSGQHLTVTDVVQSENVHSLILSGVGGGDVGGRPYLILEGHTTSIDIASLSGVTILSDVDELTITSSSKTISLTSSNDTEVVNFTYPDVLLHLYGIPESSVHVILPGTADPGPSTNPTPGGDASGGGIVVPPVGGGGIDPGTGTDTDVTIGHDNGGDLHVPPTNPGTVTDVPHTDAPNDHLVIVSLPADERTRMFITELRELLHSTNGDSHQLVLDLVNHSGIALNGTISPKQLQTNPAPATMRVEVDGQLVELHGSFEVEMSHSAPIVESSPAIIVNRGPDGEVFVDRPMVLPATNWLQQPSLTPKADFAEAAPVAAAPSDDSAVRARSDVALVGHDTSSELSTSVMALGAYIVDRVSAEFSPGQQSIVLLVDPKPSRSSLKNRNQLSAIDLFADDTSTSVLD